MIKSAGGDEQCIELCVLGLAAAVGWQRWWCRDISHSWGNGSEQQMGDFVGATVYRHFGEQRVMRKGYVFLVVQIQQKQAETKLVENAAYAFLPRCTRRHSLFCCFLGLFVSDPTMQQR